MPRADDGWCRKHGTQQTKVGCAECERDVLRAGPPMKCPVCREFYCEHLDELGVRLKPGVPHETGDAR